MRIAIRLAPRARADRLGEIARLANGEVALKVAVTAPPVEGRANDALLQLLAREWNLPRRALSIVAGAKGRSKLVHIEGDPAVLLPRLAGTLRRLSLSN